MLSCKLRAPLHHVYWKQLCTELQAKMQDLAFLCAPLVPPPLPRKPANYVQALCKRWKEKDDQANYKGEILKRTKHLLLPSKQLKKRGFASVPKANWVIHIFPNNWQKLL